MGILSFFKNIGSKILNFAKNAGSKILSGANTARDFIKKGYGFIKNIPVVGNLVEGLVNTPVPELGGMSVGNIGTIADKGLDAGNYVNSLFQH